MDHNHSGHDHAAHDHAAHDGHNHDHGHAAAAATVAQQVVQAVVENATDAIATTMKAIVAAVDPNAGHDHGSHDHSGHHDMDHSDHSSHADHSAHAGGHVDHSAHAGHEMKMYFHGGSSEVILFDFWRIDSGFGLFLSCIFIFILGAMYEGLKWFRVYLQLKESKRAQRQRKTYSPCITMSQIEASIENKCGLGRPSSGKETLLQPSSLNGTDQVYATTVKAAEDEDSTSVGFFNWSIKNSRPLAKGRILQALLYSLQITIAYFLMLIAMTYNTYLTAAVVLGAGFGHWLFAILQSASNAETAEEVTSDACH